MEYLNNTSRLDSCIFCDALAANDDRGRLIVHRGLRAFVILNRFPYNNGHLMIVPNRHVPSLEDLDVPTLTEVMTLSQQAMGVLRQVYRPQAFNLGLNVGQAAGAGVANHVHMHLLPRWTGDTNFMTAIAETRVIPEDLPNTWQKITEAWGNP